MAWDDINDTDRYGRTQLHIAAEKGREAKVRQILDQDAEVDLGDDTERTALHYAVLNGHTAIVKILLENQADPNMQDENGMSPLLLLRHNAPEILSLLIKHGANVNITDFEGKTLFNIAVQNRDVDFLKMLISHGADPNKHDQHGLSPLLNSAKAQNSQVVEFLLQLKDANGGKLINHEHKDKGGKSLQDYYDLETLCAREDAWSV